MNARGFRHRLPALTPELRETLTRHKRELVALLQAADREGLPHVLVHRLSADDLAACADLSADTLGAYLRVLARGATMDAGTVPADYTQAALCKGCGPVWLWQGAPARLRDCPWCFRRKTGKGFARPLVTCGECRHFLPDTINPAAGGGACGLGLPYRRGEAGRWPTAQRECGDFGPTASTAFMDPHPRSAPTPPGGPAL